MRLEFTYTPEDLAEAAAGAAAGGGINPAKPSQTWRAIGGWLLFIALAVMLFMRLSFNSRPRPSTATPAVVQRENLLADVLVPLIPWLLVFGFIGYFIVRQLRRSPKRVWGGHAGIATTTAAGD